MAKLYRRTAEDRYYVRVYAQSAGHPITLQVPDITRDIYESLEHEPNGAGTESGVEIPTELVWKLYEAGLHPTKGGAGSGGGGSSQLRTSSVESVPNLSEDEVTTILAVTADYDGKYREEVVAFREILGESVETKKKTGTSILTPAGWSGPPSEWDEPPTIEELFGGTQHEWQIRRGGLSDLTYRERLESVSDITGRILDYDDHPDGSQGEIYLTTVRDADEEYALRVTFRLNDARLSRPVTLIDYRGTAHATDFHVVFDLDDAEYTFELTDGLVSEFDVCVGGVQFGRFDFPDEMPDRMVDASPPTLHALVGDFAAVVALLRRLFDPFETYELESTALGHRRDGAALA